MYYINASQISTGVNSAHKIQRFCPKSFVLPKSSVNLWRLIVLITNFGFHFSFRGFFDMS